jgi:hypothetical protein
MRFKPEKFTQKKPLATVDNFGKKMASKYFALLVALNISVKRKGDRDEKISN